MPGERDDKKIYTRKERNKNGRELQGELNSRVQAPNVRYRSFARYGSSDRGAGLTEAFSLHLANLLAMASLSDSRFKGLFQILILSRSSTSLVARWHCCTRMLEQ